MMPLNIVTLLAQVLVVGNAARNVAALGLNERMSLLETGHTQRNDNLDYSSRVSGGASARPGQFKFTVYINYTSILEDTWNSSRGTKPYGGDCTGTIISQRWIITAAHCLPCPYLYKLRHNNTRFNASEEKMVVHEQCSSPLIKNCPNHTVEQYFAHPDARSYVDDCFENDTIVKNIDVALLKLKSELNFGDLVGSAGLLRGDMPSIVDNCVIMGYGDQNKTQFDGRLHYANVSAGNDVFCRLYTIEVTDFNVCARNLNNSATSLCIGDSGASLMCPTNDGFISVGVLAFISKLQGECGSNINAMVFVSTGQVEDWIVRTADDLSIYFKNL